MKTKTLELPGEIATLTNKMRVIDAELMKIDDDRARAQGIIDEAGRLDDELQELHGQRAEVKAAAFIAGTRAELSELDRQLAELERACRHAAEDGMAAARAIELLRDKAAERQAALAATREERTQLAVASLGARRDAAFKRFLEAIEALEPIVTDASAADRIINRLCGTGGDMGPALLRGIRDCRFGCEPWLWQRLAKSTEPCRFPVGWLYLHDDTSAWEDQDKVDALERLMIDAQLLAPPPPPPTPEERAARKAAEAQERAEQKAAQERDDAAARETRLRGPVVTLSYPDHPEKGATVLSRVL